MKAEVMEDLLGFKVYYNLEREHYRLGRLAEGCLLVFIGAVVPPTERFVHVSGAPVAAGAAVGLARNPSIEVPAEGPYVVPAAGLVPPVPLVPPHVLLGAVGAVLPAMRNCY